MFVKFSHPFVSFFPTLWNARRGPEYQAESGSVIIDVVRQSNPPEGVGAAFHDTGTRYIIDNVKLLSKMYEMAVKGWRVGTGDVMNAWNLAFETINAFAQ